LFLQKPPTYNASPIEVVARISEDPIGLEVTYFRCDILDTSRDVKKLEDENEKELSIVFMYWVWYWGAS